jgi:hypothetical protein
MSTSAALVHSRSITSAPGTDRKLVSSVASSSQLTSMNGSCSKDVPEKSPSELVKLMAAPDSVRTLNVPTAPGSSKRT